MLGTVRNLLVNTLEFLSIYSDSKFKRSDAFIGFQKDTPASVVFQASNLLRSATSAVSIGVDGGKWEGVFRWCKLEREHWDIKEEVDFILWNQAVSSRVCVEQGFCSVSSNE